MKNSDHFEHFVEFHVNQARLSEKNEKSENAYCIKVNNFNDQ